MVTGVELITAERNRQIVEEGYTPEHDDSYTDAQIVRAAVAYARHTYTRYSAMSWPRDWDTMRWNPSADPVRNLAKAGALIAAEIDRLQRLNGAQ